MQHPKRADASQKLAFFSKIAVKIKIYLAVHSILAIWLEKKIDNRDRSVELYVRGLG